MRHHHRPAPPARTALLALVLAGCGAEPAAVGDTPGRRVAFEIAPLGLADVGVACYDLGLATAEGPRWSLGDPAVTRLGRVQSDRDQVATAPDLGAVCSDAYGNPGLGPTAVAYVAPCDASATADTNTARDGVQNVVTLFVDGLYDAALDADVGGWQDPCPPNGCALEVDCEAQADTRVDFDFTMLRDAHKGFFDVTIAFDETFCSAKLDCVDDWFESPDGQPRKSAILGFACTAGAGQDTHLYWLDARITCDHGAFPIDPGAGLGSQGPVALAPTDGAAPPPTPGIFQHAVYRGRETLADASGVALDKCFWNMSFGFDPAGLDTNCFFDATATAASQALDGFHTAPHTAWPLVKWHVLLTGDTTTVACDENRLNGDGSGVTTIYTDVATAGEPFMVGAACGGEPTVGTTTLLCTSSGDDDVRYVTLPDGTVSVLAGGLTSAPIHLPPGLSLVTECCADPCCDSGAPPAAPALPKED